MAEVETPAETPAEEPVSPASDTPVQEAPPEFVSKSDYETGLQVLQKEVDSLRQSSDDRAKNVATVEDKVKKKLSEFDSVVELLRPHLGEDVDIQGIKRNAFLDNLIAQSTPPDSELEPDAPPQAKDPAPASVPPENQTEIAQLLEQHGLKGDEPELAEYAETNKGKPWYQVGQGFADLAQSIAARSAGDPAGVVAPQGQVSNPDLVKEFRTELDGLLYRRSEKGEAIGATRRNPNQLRTLQQKYRELGLNEEDLDVSPKGGIKQGNTIHDWMPPA